MNRKKFFFIGPHLPERIELEFNGEKITEKANIFNIRRVPLDLAYPAAVLREAGYDVSIFDANRKNVTNQEAIEKIIEFNPDIVFVSSSPLNRWQCPYHPGPVFEFVKELKKNFKGVVGLYGPHGTTLPKVTLDLSGADFVVIGEPEKIILNIARDGLNVSGCLFKQEGKIVGDPTPRWVDDLNKLPLPAYDLLPMGDYNEFIVLSSRGCPAQCVFCNKSMYGSSYRARSPKNVLLELKELKRYGDRYIYFQDLDFCFDKERVRKICDLIIKEQLNITWGCTTRVTSVNKELLEKMKQAGCINIVFGLESASPEVLKKSKKGITIEQVEKVMSWCSDISMECGFHVIFGLPGESRRTMEETAKFVKKHMGQKFINIDAGYKVIVYPGSKLFGIAKTRGLISEDADAWLKMFTISGLIDTEFNSYEEFMNAYKKIKVDLMLAKIRKKPLDFARGILKYVFK